MTLSTTSRSVSRPCALLVVLALVLPLGCGPDRPITLSSDHRVATPYYPRHSYFFGEAADGRADHPDEKLGPDEYEKPDEVDAEPPRERSPWEVPEGVKARPWRYIVIHHSATDEGSAAAFRRYHRRKGWSDLAYHFVIGNGNGSGNGAVEMGDRWLRQRIGAHARKREYNYYGIGICLVGNFEHSRPTPKQMESLRKLLEFLTERFGIDPGNVVRHKDVATTKCPGRRMPWPLEW